ncbi:MAG: FkbM family methyltransferase [Ferruginibacter sp.]
MRFLLLFCAKIINNVFGYSKQNYKYFSSWKYVYQIGLLGMGRMQGNPIEANGEINVIKMIVATVNEKLVILDVGANKGQYSLHVMKQAFSGKKIDLHIFEPSSANIKILRDHFNIIKYPGNKFFINQLALSDVNSQEFLYTDSAGSDLASLLNLKIPIRPFDNSKKEKIETMTLDNYFIKNDLKEVDFLKIDVEGAEYKVLSGGSKVIGERRIKNIQFEFGAGNITSRVFFYDFWELLSSAYNFFQVLSRGLVPVDEYSTDLEIFKTANYLLTLK